MDILGDIGLRVVGLGFRISRNFGYRAGVPRVRNLVFWGLCWAPPVLGNYHILKPCLPPPPNSESQKI